MILLEKSFALWHLCGSDGDEEKYEVVDIVILLVFSGLREENFLVQYALKL